jgi:hypothetical protein
MRKRYSGLTALGTTRQIVANARITPDLSKLKDSWPSAFVCREQVSIFSGGLINSRHLANLDCKGLGPKGRFRVGDLKIAYPVDSLIEWLEARCEMVED